MQSKLRNLLAIAGALVLATSTAEATPMAASGAAAIKAGAPASQVEVVRHRHRLHRGYVGPRVYSYGYRPNYYSYSPYYYRPYAYSAYPYGYGYGYGYRVRRPGFYFGFGF